jgi:exopolyphosphatase/guanosine-5'-triphosphate,3'-diphosphate pyrophosphatase
MSEHHLEPAAPTYAALVLGSDSFRLLVASYRDGVPVALDGEHVPLRLAAGLDARGCLSDEAMRDALDCVARLRERLRAHSLAAVRVVATSTLRMARNAHLFLPAAQQTLGHEVRVLSGEEEAMLTCLGVAGAAPPGVRALVLGIGGGSTQFALGQGMRVLRTGSIALGTVRLALTFFGAGRIDAVSFAAAVSSARVRLADRAADFAPGARDCAYGASGTVRTLARLARENGAAGWGTNGDGAGAAAGISRAHLEHLGARVLEHAGGGRPLAGLGRLVLRDVAAALAILIALMEELDIASLLGTDAGLRCGLLHDLHRRCAPVAAGSQIS